MKQLKHIFIAFIVLFANEFAFGQDASFAQFFANKLYLNPAYAGNPKHQRASLVYRNQWLTRQSPYMTYGASYDRFYTDHNSGLGINIINDMQALGTLNWLTLDVMYSYNVRVAYNAQIRGGLQAGGIFKSQNTRNLVFPDMVDPNTGQVIGNVGFAGKSSLMPDFAVGLLGEWGMFYGGIAVHHLFQPVDTRIDYANASGFDTKSRLPRKYTIHIGADIDVYKRYLIRKNVMLSPNIIYQQQGDFRQLNVGAYLSYLDIVAGIWVKNNFGMTNSTIVFMAGYHNVSYSFAYSYDFSILDGGFRGLNTSSHEVTFGVNFKYKKRPRTKVHTIKSPIF